MGARAGERAHQEHIPRPLEPAGKPAALPARAPTMRRDLLPVPALRPLAGTRRSGGLTSHQSGA
jgi:hypothetical protein